MGNCATNQKHKSLTELSNLQQDNTNLIKELQSLKEDNTNLIKELQDLKNKTLVLQNKLKQQTTHGNNTISPNTFTLNHQEKLQEFVENWFEKNSKTIDLGVINLPFGASIDIIPDHVEKRIYVKALSLLFEMLADCKLTIMGQDLQLAFIQK